MALRLQCFFFNPPLNSTFESFLDEEMEHGRCLTFVILQECVSVISLELPVRAHVCTWDNQGI